MSTKTKMCERTTRRTLGGARWFHLMVLMLVLFTGGSPKAWAADNSGLDQAFIGDKQYYVLRSAADWDKFRQLVIDAEGRSEVNAIMDADITTVNSCGSANSPYCGTFNGNGHTLNMTINSSSDERAPFATVKDGTTIRNLRVTGSVKGGQYSGGLIGRVVYSGHPTVTIERVWVSVDVTSSNSVAAGFIGHASQSYVYMSDCRYDGKLTSTYYKCAIVWWDSGYGNGRDMIWHRVYENSTSSDNTHHGFSYYWADNTGHAWGSNSYSTSLYSAHNWGEMASGCKNYTKQDDVVNKMNGEKANTWHIVDGKAVPVMQTWPSNDDVNFETYDIVPGTEDDEKGMLKIPFSCDQAVKYLDVTYTNENGQTKSIHMDCKDNTYAGFILVPATEQHKSMTIKAKLLVGSVTKKVDDKNDAVLHNPRKLSAQMLDFKTNNKLEDAGVVEVKWEVDAPEYNDAIESDQFTVMRSLTGSDDDMESIGSMSYESGTASYTFRDETLMSALTAAQLDGSTAVPQVKYRVVRAATLQLWGFSNTTASAQTTCTLPMLHLLRVKDYQTAWADQTARTVKVTWQYAEEAGAVWDDRAKMNIVVSSTNREGAAVNTNIFPITEAEMTAREKVIQLDRSCVDYSIVLDVERGESVLPVEAPYFEIRTAEDWATFCQKIIDSGGKNVNASLLADISVGGMAGINSDKPYRGTFEGNGHTLTVNITGKERFTAIFRYVGNSTFRNLHLAGSVESSQMYATGLVGEIKVNSAVTIENCQSSVNLTCTGGGDKTMSGFVGRLENASLTISNCKFDGSFDGAGSYGHGGFVSWEAPNSNVTVDNCLFAPTKINTNFDTCETWVRKDGGSSTVCTVINCHATREYNSSSTSYTNYFLINNAADWDAFRMKVEEAGGNSDVNAVLNADITVSNSIGYHNAYRGTFNGNGHTLTLNFNTTEGYSAPFYNVSGATIENLHVAGTINTSVKFAAGIAGGCLGTNTIRVCRVSATINSSVDGDATNGGFVAIVGTNATLNITDCLFDGKFTGDKCHSNGGFVGWNDGNTTITNCLFNGTSSTLTTGCRTFARSRDASKVTLTNVYYATSMDDGTKQGTSTDGLNQQTMLTKLGENWWYIPDGWIGPKLLTLVIGGNMAGKTPDQMIALLGSGWTKDANGQATPKMADNKQENIPYSAKHPFMIHSTADWDTFRQIVENAKGEQDVCAQLMADITITEPAGLSTGYFRGTFDGCGHTLTADLDKNWESVAPFQHVTGNNTVIRNLNVKGTIKGKRYIGGVAGIGINEDDIIVVENCHVSADLITTDHYAGGIVGNGQWTHLTVRNCLFDGTITNAGTTSSWVAASAFIGMMGQEATYIKAENCLDNGTYTNFKQTGAIYSNNHTTLDGTNNWTYKQLGGVRQVGTMTNAALVDSLGGMWQLDVTGKPVPKSAGSLIDGMETFYYENLGHIDPNSLQIRTLPTSTVLTWANQTEEPVDYYEVYRKDKESGGYECIVTQLTDMQYEDKQTSPVHQYIYKVRGVTSCEGLHYDETKEVEGMCEQTGTVEGRLCFLDGTGIPGQTIIVTVDGKERSAKTDDSGFFRFKDLPYKDKKETYYTLTTTVGNVKGVDITLGTEPGKNVVKNVLMEVGTSIKLSGYVQYDGTSIPVQGVSFKVDGHEVRNSAGLVTTDHEGKFAFRILEGTHDSIQAVKDGHLFWRDGFYHENDDDPDTQKKYSFTADKAGLMFYDQTRVKMIGRIVGGKTQGELPLGYALSKNNLGDSLRMVLTLEGDNASRLVFDIQDRSLKERDEVFLHEKANAKDKQTVHQTKVHTTLNRKVVYPDVHTGEYEVMLPPVKWKIQQITASGYATLFQDGQIGDVIDLSDSLTEHKITKKGEWETASYKVTDPVEEYYALYNRIYHSPVRIEYRQQGFDDFDYFGEHYYSYQNLSGAKEKLALAYGVRKKDWPVGKRDSMETHYTFGHPVFNIDRKYGFTISATEKYYYNNNTKSDTVDVVHLSGGVVTIHNGMVSATHRDTLHLDSLGQANYTIEAAQTPYLLTGDDALCTVSMSLEMDGTHYEAEPLKAYVLNVKPKTGAKDILPTSMPMLVDILRDPPGGTSKATLSKGSTLKYSYQMDMSWSAGLSIGLDFGFGMNTSVGIVAAPFGVGGVTTQQVTTASSFGTSIDLICSGSGQRAFNYTMTATEDISTSSDPKMVGADADLYIGVEQNIVLKPATAIRAIPDSVYQQSAGLLKSGRMVQIADGVDEKGKTLHLVRDEVVTYGPTIKSNFVHSQQYIVKQLIPSLREQCLSLIFTGTKEEAQLRADSTDLIVYRSLVTEDSDDFGIKYEPVKPSAWSADKAAAALDEVDHYHGILQKWVEMIAQNEKEKMTATELVSNYDVDGGGSVNYGETFQSDYTVMNSFVNPFTPMIDGYFDSTAGNVLVGIAAIVGPTVAKFVGGAISQKAGKGLKFDLKGFGAKLTLSFMPVVSFNVTPKHTESKSYSRKESFSIGMDKKSHLDFDVYKVKTNTANLTATGNLDVFTNANFNALADYDEDYLVREFKTSDFIYPRSFVYRTRGGATCRPWEGERQTLFYNPGTVMDERTKKIENPQIKMDKQSVSGVPFGEPARFKLYLTNESEQPEAAYPYFDLYQVDKSNPNGARLMIDGVPLTGNMRTVEVRPGQVTEKTLEVYASEAFDYEGLTIGLISQGDLNTYQQVSFDVHYLQTAGAIAISSPGDKWIMNCDAPTDGAKGWYLPVVISGFDKNQHNFDHIEFQYKETTRGDDYWTNLCGYYADSTLYKAATGTKEMIPENGNIQTRFFGEGTVMEKGYDLRAVLFCRNGNSFLTNESKVLSGVKDTRRPQLFGTPQPKSGVLGPGENIIFDFSEDIEYNYLQATTNFEVTGETNETAVQEAPSLQFGGEGYAQTQSRRNFAGKNLTVEVMIKPEATGTDMPIFSHGSDGKQLQLWLTAEKKLKAIVGDKELTSDSVLNDPGFQRVAMVLDNDNQRLMLYGKQQIGSKDEVTYSGSGPLTFGAAEESGTTKYFTGRMLQGRLWYRALDLAGLNRYGGKLLTGYEMGLVDYYPMNDGRGTYASDQAQGAHLTLNGASWAQPEGMSLKIDSTETRQTGEYKGLELRSDLFQRDDEQDYTLMFWFKTPNKSGTLLANGAGKADDEGALHKFFIGFENRILKYRTNGREFTLGDNLCDDGWHHYAMTVNRARNVASIYIDNEAKAQLTTDSLGGMLGTHFYLGNMVYQEKGKPEVKQANAFTGHIDGLLLFEQALPKTLIKRYSEKSPGGEERGLLLHMPFDHQVRQKSGELTLQPLALSNRVKRDNDGNDTGKRDSVFVNSVDEILAHVDRTMGAPVQAYEHLRNLNFSYVGRDNQLLVNIDEQDARINKQNVYVTLYDIPDKNGNFMKSPATECFFVNRNPLTWMTLGKHRAVTVQQGQSLTLIGMILNNGGKAHTYTIENVPRWITVDKTSDIVQPQGEDEIDFTISPNLEVGTYDQMIYLTDENGMSDAYYLELTVEGKTPEWKVDPSMMRYSMNVVAQVFVNNTLVTDSHDVVAAFDADGRCMGVNNIEYDPATGQSMLYMTVYDSTTVATQVFFRLWHYATGKTMELETSEFIYFGNKTVVGTIDKPVTMRAVNKYQQTIDLAQGWNWISFNVFDPGFGRLSSVLNRFEWQEGDILTEDTEGLTLVYKKGQWISTTGSDIMDLQLSQKVSYSLLVQDAHQIDIWGIAFEDDDERTITVKPGWSSIGYTPLVNLPVTTALTEYFDEATPGDVVKNQHEFAMFTADGKGGGKWQGTLKYMKPGEGYMMHRQKQTTATFTYPFYEPGENSFETTVAYAPQRASARFAKTMNVVAEAVGVELQEGDRLVAFAGGEQVGKATVMSATKPLTTEPLFFLSIEGDQKAPLSFAIERGDEIIATTGEVMNYEVNGISGTVAEPTKISFVKTEHEDSQWYSVSGMKLQKRPTQSGVYIFNGKKHVIK